jgi:hypothetical protein
VDTGSPQKMRPSKEIERFHDSTQHESALEHDPEKWEPVSRLREARFGGRRKVGKDHAQTKG